MTIDFSTIPFPTGEAPVVPRFPSSTNFAAINDWIAGIYRYYYANILLLDYRDESLANVTTPAVDEKYGTYPWYNDSDRPTEEDADLPLWDCLCYYLPYRTGSVLPGANTSVSSGATAATRGRLKTTVRARNAIIRTVIQRVTVDRDINGFATGTVTPVGTCTAGQIAIPVSTGFQGYDYDTLLPTGWDPTNLDEWLMVSVYFTKYLPNANVPGLLSFLQLWEEGPSDFPDGSY